MSWSSATLVKCPLGLFMRSFLRLKVGNLHLGFRGVELSGLTEMIICTSQGSREVRAHTHKYRAQRRKKYRKSTSNAGIK